MRAVRLMGLAALLGVFGCSTPVPPPAKPESITWTHPYHGPLVPRVAMPQPLPVTPAAREAFARACTALLRREDRSGLTRPEDWKPACTDPEQNPASFFARHFTPVRLGDGKGFSTGYYEPEISGSKAPKPGSAPIYAKPSDLVEIPLAPFASDLSGRSIRGRWTGKTVVPYFSRAEIADGALANRNLEIAWADDPVELFFLEIQGSGRLRLPDGSMLRLGYAGQNGHPYVAIGRLLKQREGLQRAGMEDIIGWIRSNPEKGRALMRENPSQVFFQLRDGADDGPLGTLGVPLIAKANAAADPATLPLGAPLLASLTVDGSPTSLLLIAADTGGAIRGPNRIDIFWGAGPKARATAANLAAPADILLLLPHSAAARLPQ